jgi:hypothetical protein
LYFVCAALMWALAVGSVARASEATVTVGQYIAQGALDDPGSNVICTLDTTIIRKRTQKQRLELVLTGLAPSTTYELFAQCGSDTNWAWLSESKSDASGTVVVRKIKRPRTATAQSWASVCAPAAGLARAKGIAVTRTNGAAAATVTFRRPELYSVSGALKNTGVEIQAIGAFALSRQRPGDQFRVLAMGLSGTYTLAINGQIFGSYMADESGMLNIGAYPDGAPDLLEVRSVSLSNANGEPVLAGVIE